MTIEDKNQGFKQNAESISTPYVPSTSEEEAARIEHIIDMAIGDSQRLWRLWEEYRHEFSIQFRFSHDVPYADTGAGPIGFDSGRLYSCKNLIRLNPDEPDSYLALAFWHETRHALQNSYGYRYPPVKPSLFDYIWFTRVKEADAESFHAITEFSKKLEGDGLLFDENRHSGSMYASIYRTVEDAYANEPKAFDDGRLRRIAFDACFENEELRLYYETRNLKFYKELLETYAWFKKAGAAFSARSLTSSDFVDLGRLDPNDKDYLNLPGFRSLDDPYYRLNFASEEVKKLWAKECAKKTSITSKKSLPKLG